MSAQRKIKAKSAWKCETEGCEDEAYTLGLCKACYSYMVRWAKAKPKHRRAHQKKVEKFAVRLEDIARSTTLRSVK